MIWIVCLAVITNTVAAVLFLRARRALAAARAAAVPAPKPQVTAAQAALLGFEPDHKVTIDSRHWESLKRIVWRMKTSWGFVGNESADLVASCRHTDGCPGAKSDSETCLRSCPDRQTRLSALVILANSREFEKVTAPTPTKVSGAGYMPPTREFFDSLLSDLVAAQSENEFIKNLLIESVGVEEARKKIASANTIPAPTSEIVS